MKMKFIYTNTTLNTFYLHKADLSLNVSLYYVIEGGEI